MATSKLNKRKELRNWKRKGGLGGTAVIALTRSVGCLPSGMGKELL